MPDTEPCPSREPHLAHWWTPNASKVARGCPGVTTQPTPASGLTEEERLWREMAERWDPDAEGQETGQ